ncbi:MAG: hypothetical protein JWN73_7 [Betaproteobacteria bacterium]|nr:hypothetical protein [Betaproteobacteria bacterium]
MAKASPIQTSFNAGELSPRLEGRVDLGKYANGAKRIENFLLSVQGPAIRRAGTRYVGEVKNSADRSWLLRFEFNITQAYVLEFGDHYIRFYANHGQVVVSGVAAWVTAHAYSVGDLALQGGVNYTCVTGHTSGTFATDLAAGDWAALTGALYEIPTPYSAADLTDADGTLKLRFAQSGDIIYIAHPGYQPRKLTRFGGTKWTLTEVANAGGPFKTNPPDDTRTVYASANTGSVTLTANVDIFTAAQIGALFYLGEKDVRSVVQWEVGKSYSAGQIVRSNGVNYQALNSATSGGVKPTHTYGAVYDGAAGVQWQYLDPGYGWVKITAFTDTKHATATVLSRIPDNAVGSTNATSRWALGAWNNTDGYPSQVTFFRERLVFAAVQSVWMSVTGDYENFNPKDSLGNIAADGAISITIVARKVNQVQWLDPGIDLLIGTAGGEFRCSEMTKNQVFGPDNVTVQPQSEYGSRSLAPLRIGSSIVYVQRSGRTVREMAYDFGSDSYKSTDVTVLAEHISQTGLTAADFQQEPYSIIWYARADGLLAGLTFNREQDVVGWHRHPIGGDGIVEAVTCIPTPDGGRNELWLIVRRTVNGATKRYVEYLEVEHQDGDDIERAFYLDAGLSFDGKVNATLTPGVGATVAHATAVPFSTNTPMFAPGDIGRSIHYRYLQSTEDANNTVTQSWVSAKASITAYTDAQHVSCTIDAAFPASVPTLLPNSWRMTVTTLTGLAHLEGMTVDVLANGASHPQRVVSGGSIALQFPASVVHAGLPCPAKLWTMRLNAGGADGTSQGKTARINKLAIRFQETIGAQYGPDAEHLDELPFRATGDPMDQPPPLFTGDKLVEFDGDYGNDPRVYIQNNQPFPATIVAVMPQTHVYDR